MMKPLKTIAVCCMIVFLLGHFKGIGAATRDIGVRKVAETYGFSGYDPSRFHALVIGIDNYSHFNKLACAVNDAREVARVLKETFGFRDVKLVTDQNATRRGILRRLEGYRKLTPEDSLLVFYAGHGMNLEDAATVGYWIPYDGEPDDISTYLPNSQLVNDYFKLYDVRHLVVITDSCFGGALLRGSNDPQVIDPSVLSRFRKPSRWVLTSGNLEPVPDADGRHSPFCNRLLQFMQYDNPVFDLHDLYAYIKNNIQTEAVLGALDTTMHTPGGEFVFIRHALPGERLPVPEQTAVAALPPAAFPSSSVHPAADNTNAFIFTYPEKGTIDINGRRYYFSEETEILLPKGKFDFKLTVDGARRPIYGYIDVQIVDEETKKFPFGLQEGEPLFKETHIRAALHGSPVSYVIQISGPSGKRTVANYTLSLRKLW